MDIVRLTDARPYVAPGHHGMRAVRLQGMDASAADFAWVGLSTFEPGGGADRDTGATGKIYVVLDGAVTIALGSGEVHVLRRLDSCFIPAGEARAVHNAGGDAATMLVVMPHAEPRT